MANIRDIRTKIKSVKSTQKITKAMEMVAASKIRKAQQRMMASRPYAHGVREVIAHLTQGSLEYKHPYLVERPIKRVGLILVSTDRGLCGALNTGLFKDALATMEQLEQQHISVDLCTIGNKAEMFFKRHHAHIIAGASFLGDHPTVKEIIGVVKVMLDAYESGKLDQIIIMYNTFVNMMTQRPSSEVLLPVSKITDTVKRISDYIYEPAPEPILDLLLERYIESLVYQAVIENAACEQAARMVAMRNASDNAQELLESFQLMYNKARQAGITKELAEIVAGADAV